MGKHQRRKIGEINRLRKRLKFPLSRVARVMPKGFTDAEFLDLFKTAYPGLWVELMNFFKSSMDEYRNRINKGLKGVKPFYPKDMVFLVAKSSLAKTRIINSNSSIEQEYEKAEERAKIIREGKSKANKIQQLEAERIRKFQKVAPKYVDNLIKLYFNQRKENALDIDTRYLIILECAKFKCKKTIVFLQKINACEKNNELRILAYEYLVRFGINPRLTRKRKGKKKLTATTVHKIEESPSVLLQLIFEKQQILHKNFDVFLSHSYGRQSELLQTKEILNRQGLVVYVDWINDAEMLQREKQNDDTFNVLYERLRQSSALLFIQTKLSVASKYCLDELIYFKQLNRPMYLYEAEPIEIHPEILDGMIKVKLEGGKFLTEDNVDILDKKVNYKV